MNAYWGSAYGIEPGPWATFGGPAPTPPMEWRVTSTAPEGWPREWAPVADARTLHNLLELRDDGRNYHGIRIRLAGDAQLAMELSA